MGRRSLPGLRALITGASSGIGRALAVELARYKVRTLLMARNEAALREVQALTASSGVEAVISAGDVTNPTDRDRAMGTAHQELGGLDLLVNNAGISAHGDFASESPEVTRRIFEVNYFAAIDLTRAALPLLHEGQSPMIVNVGSILGHRAIPFHATYCASKFALAGWSESLRAELNPHGIDVLVVSPGTTDTPFTSNLVERRITLPWANGKGVSPEKVARATRRAIQRGKREIIPNCAGWWLVTTNRWAPRVMDGVMASLARKGFRQHNRRHD